MGRLKGCLWLVAGLLVAALAGFVAYTTLQRAEAQRATQEAPIPKVQVVAATPPGGAGSFTHLTPATKRGGGGPGGGASVEKK